ncbi:MerR family transcriptional regulator [Umezawaea sp. Da 62-37]|uniref:MerR family transcriptional regulator n=1 Tax=Umezawaea sp. Da 62-37 TaxID=3075927 RepID=UPI0028F6F5CC|nr:MerR family transcriptional regulator [Umezawaea sp. Da 62-37]WNV90010.1 MerR family transcriptional regulator [Umezawaea sp. Da 62-37]
MFSIGDFAKHGRVSVRMLRHYDEIGLLRPAHVDRFTGYRSYEGSQLARLNRVIALKDLGLTLAQVGEILDEKVSAESLRGMLRLRRAELEAAIAADRTRLARVEARLRTIESEGSMPTDDVVVKSVPAARVAELSGTAGGFAPEHISPVIGPLYDELNRRLEAAGVVPVGPAIAYYEQSDDGVVVHAGHQVAPSATGDFAVVDLPAVAEMATIVHRGSMEAVMPSVQALARWIEANGYRSTGPSRELYLEHHADHDRWVTELQEPIGPA